jgi:hypothetical protein
MRFRSVPFPAQKAVVLAQKANRRATIERRGVFIADAVGINNSADAEQRRTRSAKGSGRGLPVIGHEARHSNLGIDLSTGSQAIGCSAFNNRGIGID